MMSQLHHTKSDDAWVEDVLARLPADLASSAREYGAFSRVRAFADPSHLLRGLLAYACCLDSLRALAVWGVLTDVADITPASWLERLRQSANWLQALVAGQLALAKPRWLDQAVRGRILLIDATCLSWRGGTGNDIRLHLAYDLLSAQIAQVVATDRQGAEHVRHFSFAAGDLAVLDAGYGFRDRVAHLQQQQADALVGVYPPTFPLEHADGQRLDLRGWLDSPGLRSRSRLAYYQHADKRYAVRVLAWQVSEPKRQAVRQRAKERARKRMRPVGEVVQYYADWVVLVTTLLDEQHWPDEKVWRLYGGRWQVEVLFKALKQFLELGELPARSAASAQAVVWGRLLVWVLHEPNSRALVQKLQALAQPQPQTYPGQQPEREAVVSVWSCQGLVLATLVGAIRGTWTLARLEECLPRLVRFVAAHPRADRSHQASEVAAWLTGQRRTRPRAQQSEE